MLVAAVFVPTPPLLVPEVAGGSAALDEPLREACRAAVARMLAAAPECVVVVGTAPTRARLEGTWDWRGFGVPRTPTVSRRLPLAPAIGSWLLDTHPAPTPPRLVQGIPAEATAQECEDLGVSLAAARGRVGLLVCGDGSACRGEKAPGHLDAAAQPWDDAAVAALRTADGSALLALDIEIGERVMATGRAPWQVLAGAATGAAFDAQIDWAGTPYGVMYVAGTWIRKESPAP